MRCANCGAGVATRFCGNCGQSRHDHSRSMLEVLRELIEHHLFLDGKMMMTLAALLLRPGMLTRAFIEGRRVRFVSPIRLYLFASFAFFPGALDLGLRHDPVPYPAPGHRRADQ